MKKHSMVFVLFIGLLISPACEKNKNPFVPETMPTWLKQKIDAMQDQPLYYGGTNVLRYYWNHGYYYSISIPVSSCMGCEIYDQSGNKVNWSESQFADFWENKTDMTFVWVFQMETQ
jgi:hypothetical protein